jgi:uncharacterized membrane protein
VVTPDQPWLAWIIAAVILLSLLAGGWFGTRRLLARRAAKRAAQAAALSAASSPEPMYTPPIAAADPSPPADAASAPNAALNTPDATPSATTVAADSAPAAAPSAPPTDRFELTIEANKKTKVTVVADKDMVFEGTMKSGEKQFFSAADHFQVSAKDAGALHLGVNGHALGPLGRPGHSAKVTLTRDALKGASGGGN